MTYVPYYKRFGDGLYSDLFRSVRFLKTIQNQYPKAPNAPSGLLAAFRKRFKPVTSEESRQQSNDARNLETLSEDEFLKS